MRVRLRCKLYSFKTGESQVIHALNDVVMDRCPKTIYTYIVIIYMHSHGQVPQDDV